MSFDFRLTVPWHAPIIRSGPARIAPFGPAALRSPMATASERIHQIEVKALEKMKKSIQ